MFNMSAEELVRLNKDAEEVLEYDRQKTTKPKLRCKLFGHKWYTHYLIPPPHSRRRTICNRCKISKIVYEERKLCKDCK